MNIKSPDNPNACQERILANKIVISNVVKVCESGPRQDFWVNFFFFFSEPRSQNA